MAHNGIVIFDCIIMTAYYAALFCIISQFKHRKSAGLLLLIIYEMAFWLADWNFSSNKAMTGPNTDIDISLIFSITDIVLVIVFFSVFMKDNPFVNYCIYIITDTFSLIMLFLSVKLRELLTPNLPPIGLAAELSDWPVLLFQMFAYGGTLLIAFLLIPMLKKLLGKLPDKLLYGILLFYLLSEFFILVIMIFNAEIITKSLIAAIAFLLVISVLVILLFFFTIKIYHAERLQKDLILLEMERQQQFYSFLYKIGVRLRHLKHDLSNHKAVMELTENMDQEASEKYRRQLLAHYKELTEEMHKSNLERI